VRQAQFTGIPHFTLPRPHLPLNPLNGLLMRLGQCAAPVQLITQRLNA
jgi:hypothetical protein